MKPIIHWEKCPDRDSRICPPLETPRLYLEPITSKHADLLYPFYADPLLHTHVEFKPPTREEQKEHCLRWSRRRSSDGKTLHMNWVAKEKSSGLPMGHFQARLTLDHVATVGYLVARSHQGKGYATEGMLALFDFLASHHGAKEARAHTDTQNEAARHLALKLGMELKDTLKSVSHFKGSWHDECVFSIELPPVHRK